MQQLINIWLIRVTGLLLLAVGLVACGTSATIPGGQGVTAEPCVIEEYTPPGAVLGGSRMQPNPEESPAYCSDETVLADYREALELALWYAPPANSEACTTAVEPPDAYPDTLIDDLATFYTGELLHTARETIYYNQQASPRRLVLACWDVAAFDEQFEDADDGLEVEWAPDGRSVVINQTIKDYTWLTYEVRNGEPVLVNDVLDEQADGTSFWATTMVYDDSEGAQRWKIVRAHNTIPSSR
jgi:hypothetical protein